MAEREQVDLVAVRKAFLSTTYAWNLEGSSEEASTQGANAQSWQR
jgi:hypothetical protein